MGSPKVCKDNVHIYQQIYLEHTLLKWTFGDLNSYNKPWASVNCKFQHIMLKYSFNLDKNKTQFTLLIENIFIYVQCS